MATTSTANTELASTAELWATEANELRERLVFVCMRLAPARGRYAYLEKRTGISASKWKNLFLCRQMPTIEMLVAITHYWPNYAPWVVTGDVDPWGKSLSTEQKNPEGAGSTIPTGVVYPEAPESAEWLQFKAHRAWVKDEKTGGNKEG